MGSFSDVIPGLDLTICNDCENLLMIKVKEKLDKCHTREERIQLLTLMPEHWSRERQALVYEKQGHATIPCLATKFRGYRREKSHATHQVGVWWHAMIIPFRTPQFLFWNEVFELQLKQN